MDSDGSASFGGCPRPKKSKPSSSEESSPCWAHLPSVVIHEIFDLLDREDRKNASSVCKNWRQNAFHPKWWPNATFKIKPGESERSKFFTSTFGPIVTNAKIQVDTLTPECTDEFVILIETLSENNNLKELIIEPTHCQFEFSRHKIEFSDNNVPSLITKLIKCLPNLTKFSIGCLEEFAFYLEEYLTNLARHQPAKVTLLGFASVKDNPNEYLDSYFECDLIKPFPNLKVLSIDFDQLSDYFLSCLDTSKHLERLIVHLHGVREGHPGTSENGWSDFNSKHPDCELRLNIIHSYDEIQCLHETILKPQMPLTHLRVLFCESVNVGTLEFLASYCHRLRSLVWVDSRRNTKKSRALVAIQYDYSPDPLVMMVWMCKSLSELVFYGYKYREENLVAIARLKGEMLKKFEIAQEDIMFCNNSHMEQNLLNDIQLHLRQPWTPTQTSDLHPVIRDARAGDSDEYLLPIVLADLHYSNRSASPVPQQQAQPQPMGIVSTNSAQSMVYSRRVLRPRTEPRSYVESPDVLINVTLDKPRTNGNADYSSDSSEGEMPPLAPIKELSPSELKQRDRGLRRLREDLRAEEMKLVLLKKLKQSQQLKENVAVLPPSIPQSALPPTGLPSGLSITPTTVKVPSNKNQPPQSIHSRHPNSHKTGQGSVPSLLRGQDS